MAYDRDSADVAGNADPRRTDEATLGDSTLVLPACARTNVPGHARVAKQFGEPIRWRTLGWTFLIGEWQGPVASAYVVHLVLVQRTHGKAHLPELLSEVREMPRNR
jgi:hypothetical protein